MKIIVDGHGGHLCEANLDGTGIMETGDTIEDAIGRLVFYHQKDCGVDIEILPCETTAYERSGVRNNPVRVEKHV